MARVVHFFCLKKTKRNSSRNPKALAAVIKTHTYVKLVFDTSEALSPAPTQVKQVPNTAALDQPATVAFIRPLYPLMKTSCFHHPAINMTPPHVSALRRGHQTLICQSVSAAALTQPFKSILAAAPHNKRDSGARGARPHV